MTIAGFVLWLFVSVFLANAFLRLPPWRIIPVSLPFIGLETQIAFPGIEGWEIMIGGIGLIVWLWIFSYEWHELGFQRMRKKSLKATLGLSCLALLFPALKFYQAWNILPSGVGLKIVFGFMILTAPLALIVALIEEIEFRGILFSAVHFLPSWSRVPITSLLFGAFHIPSYGFTYGLYTMWMGLLLGAIRQQSQSIYPSIILHFIVDVLVLWTVIFGFGA